MISYKKKIPSDNVLFILIASCFRLLIKCQQNKFSISLLYIFPRSTLLSQLPLFFNVLHLVWSALVWFCFFIKAKKKVLYYSVPIKKLFRPVNGHVYYQSFSFVFYVNSTIQCLSSKLFILEQRGGFRYV